MPAAARRRGSRVLRRTPPGALPRPTASWLRSRAAGAGSSHREIWLMNADGSDQRLLVRGWHPVWSPNGTRDCVRSGLRGLRGGYRCGHTVGLWTVRTDGSDIQLVSAASATPAGRRPAGRLVFEAGLAPTEPRTGLGSQTRMGRIPGALRAKVGCPMVSERAADRLQPRSHDPHRAARRRKDDLGSEPPTGCRSGPPAAPDSPTSASTARSARPMRRADNGTSSRAPSPRRSTELKYSAPVAAWSPRGPAACLRPRRWHLRRQRGRGDRERVVRRANGVSRGYQARWSADGRRLPLHAVARLQRSRDLHGRRRRLRGCGP